MGIIKRRDFIKQCGIGAGALLTANIWSQALFADPTKSLSAPDYQQLFGISKEEMKKLHLLMKKTLSNLLLKILHLELV